MLTTLLLALSVACAERPAAPPTDAVQAGAPAVALHGDRVDTPLPDFAGVVASDGSSRGKDALLGQPTALWFYPAAGTPG